MCIFCEIASGAKQTRAVYETEDVFAFKDLNPQAPTHILIIPKEHIDRLDASDDSHIELLGKIQRAAAIIAKELKLKDFRLVTNNGKGAGQTVDHLHYHLLAGRRFLWPPG
ncbi:histidine triad (HIT) family protein [Parelusimicrobium proximum]|uniref:histidine triad nucleotide-binding protein n=1 Tax=Parelusimicrobium proximum TaxID=3228953 RepID=UPI003D17A164